MLIFQVEVKWQFCLPRLHISSTPWLFFLHIPMQLTPQANPQAKSTSQCKNKTLRSTFPSNLIKNPYPGILWYKTQSNIDCMSQKAIVQPWIFWPRIINSPPPPLGQNLGYKRGGTSSVTGNLRKNVSKFAKKPLFFLWFWLNFGKFLAIKGGT